MTSITQKIGRLLVFAVVLAAVIAPWGWATYRDYGVPFYSSTNSFKYMTSWPDHFMNRGAPTLNDYLRQPIHQIIRDKCIMLWVIASHFWFVFTPVLALGFVIAVWKRNGGSLGKVGALIFAAFMAGTLVNIAAIDQVKDFGRYFLPVLAVLIPVAWKGVIDYLAQFQSERTSSKRLESVVLVLVVSAFWGALDWTHNYRFLSNDFHERLVLQKLIGEKIAKELPKDAIVMTFYPWEVHMYSGRKTVLMPRNFDPVRLREEVREYGVTHIVFENGVGNRNFPAILKEFHLENRATEIYQQLAKDQIGVYPIREN